MKRADFISRLDHAAIETAISQAEQATSGEIRVVVVAESVAEPVAAAQAAFEKLGMTATRERNAVLFYIAPRSQTFAVIGDEGVHQRCGPVFWEEIAASMTSSFKAGDYTAGLVQGITRAGKLLGEQFPRRPDDKNELPNKVMGP